MNDWKKAITFSYDDGVTQDKTLISLFNKYKAGGCDRENLSKLAGYEVIGMAYPGGGVNYTEHAAKIIAEHTGVKYARTTVCNYGFERQKHLYEFHPTVYHVMEMEQMFELGKLL